MCTLLRSIMCTQATLLHIKMCTQATLLHITMCSQAKLLHFTMWTQAKLLHIKMCTQTKLLHITMRTQAKLLHVHRNCLKHCVCLCKSKVCYRLLRFHQQLSSATTQRFWETDCSIGEGFKTLFTESVRKGGGGLPLICKPQILKKLGQNCVFLCFWCLRWKISDLCP